MQLRNTRGSILREYAKIEEKRIWLRDYEPDEYAHAVGEDRDIFELWREKGYIDEKLR